MFVPMRCSLLLGRIPMWPVLTPELPPHTNDTPSATNVPASIANTNDVAQDPHYKHASKPQDLLRHHWRNCVFQWAHQSCSIRRVLPSSRVARIQRATGAIWSGWRRAVQLVHHGGEEYGERKRDTCSWVPVGQGGLDNIHATGTGRKGWRGRYCD